MGGCVCDKHGYIVEWGICIAWSKYANGSWFCFNGSGLECPESWCVHLSYEIIDNFESPIWVSYRIVHLTVSYIQPSAYNIPQEV